MTDEQSLCKTCKHLSESGYCRILVLKSGVADEQRNIVTKCEGYEKKPDADSANR